MSTDTLDHDNDVLNLNYGVEYTPNMLNMMLLAYQDNNGDITWENERDVRLLFSNREAWKLGTQFRSVWCGITSLQVGLMALHGWTGAQIDAHNMEPGPPGINILALLFHVLFFEACLIDCPIILPCSSPNTEHRSPLYFFQQGTADAPTDQISADRYIAQIHWNRDIERDVTQIIQTTIFQGLQAVFFTGVKLVEYGIIPLRLLDADELVQCLRVGLGICAAVRIFRDGLAAEDAFLAVINSSGLSAEFFG